MNINLTLPASTLERLLSALERIADAAERMAPDIEIHVPEPFSSSDWLYSSNAQSREQELIDRQEATGYGPTYQADIESRAYTAQRPPNGPDIKQG